MNVSVVIVNYNTTDLVLQCIKSIYQQTEGLTFEIIVVDNNSPDRSIELIINQYPNIVLIKSLSNLGFGKANNLGYKYSHGEYLFFLNPDTFLINNAIKILCDFLNRNKQIGIVGGQLYNLKGEENHSYGLFLPSIMSELNMMFNNLFFNIKKSYLEKHLMKNDYCVVAYITGADMMVRRKDIDKYGLFDSNFFMYFEETELAHRYDSFGKKSAFVPSAKIVHMEGASFTFKEAREKKYFEGRKIYYKKVHSIYYKKISNSIFVLTCIVVVFFNMLLFRHNKCREWNKRLNIFYNEDR